jgi:hypothetical protein
MAETTLPSALFGTAAPEAALFACAPALDVDPAASTIIKKTIAVSCRIVFLLGESILTRSR